MQQKNTIVNLGAHFEQYIAKQIHEGCYDSTSETFCAGLRLLEEKELKLEIFKRL